MTATSDVGVEMGGFTADTRLDVQRGTVDHDEIDRAAAARSWLPLKRLRLAAMHAGDLEAVRRATLPALRDPQVQLPDERAQLALMLLTFHQRDHDPARLGDLKTVLEQAVEDAQLVELEVVFTRSDLREPYRSMRAYLDDAADEVAQAASGRGKLARAIRLLTSAGRLPVAAALGGLDRHQRRQPAIHGRVCYLAQLARSYDIRTALKDGEQLLDTVREPALLNMLSRNWRLVGELPKATFRAAESAARSPDGYAARTLGAAARESGNRRLSSDADALDVMSSVRAPRDRRAEHTARMLRRARMPELAAVAVGQISSVAEQRSLALELDLPRYERTER